MQTFTKKFITFEPNEIFEFSKSIVKFKKRIFTKKNHELDENKRNA